MKLSNLLENSITRWGGGLMAGGKGVHKNLTFADRGRGGGVKNGPKNADVINERPLSLLDFI